MLHSVEPNISIAKSTENELAQASYFLLVVALGVLAPFFDVFQAMASLSSRKQRTLDEKLNFLSVLKQEIWSVL